MKRIVANFILALSTTVLVLSLSDLMIGWCLKVPLTKEMRKIIDWNDDLHPRKRLKKNIDVDITGEFREYTYHLKTNSDGFRQNTSAKTQEVKPELIFLGDSQTFGIGINNDETFVAKATKILKIAMLNTACPGYNTIEEFQLTRELLERYKPKVLVLCFFAGNDPYENYSNRKQFSYDGNASPTIPTTERKNFSAFQELKAFLIRNSSMYNLVIRLRQFKPINQLLFRYQLVNHTPPSELVVFQKADTLQKKAFWKVTDSVLFELNRYVSMHGIKLVIVLIPDRYQVDDAYWSQWRNKYQLNIQNYDRLEPNKHLKLFAEQSGISFLDLTPFLRNAIKQGNRVYWKIDNHLNPNGHAAVAEVLSRYFLQNRWFDIDLK